MATAAANLNIPPPATFNPSTDDWNQWIPRYELFEAAKQRDGLSCKVRINTLIYVMGNATDIYQSFKISSKETRLTNVKPKFKEHFKGKVEVALVLEGTQFERRLERDKEGGYAIYRRSPETGSRLFYRGSTGSNGQSANIVQFTA